MSTQAIFDVRAALEKFGKWVAWRGWKAAEDGSWVKAQGEYHVFLYCRSISLSTLKSMVRNSKCSIFEDGLWSVREATLMVFIFPRSLTPELTREVEASPELTSKALLYDFGRLTRLGKGNNITDEFERFLRGEYGLSFCPLQKASP